MRHPTRVDSHPGGPPIHSRHSRSTSAGASTLSMCMSRAIVSESAEAYENKAYAIEAAKQFASQAAEDEVEFEIEGEEFLGESEE
jgi:hypothetical protein